MMEDVAPDDVPQPIEDGIEAFPGLGRLLEETDGAKVADDVKRLVEAQSTWHSFLCATWDRNKLWRKGRRGVRILSDPTTGLYEAKVPKGAAEASPSPNNLDKLIRRVAATLTVDAPLPEVHPETDDTDDRDRAELTERLLRHDAGESGTNHAKLLRQAVDLGGTYASAFLHVYPHPTKGGRVPAEIEAHPLATSLAANRDDGQPALDDDGQPVADASRALINPETGEPDPAAGVVLKYLAEDGVTLLDSPKGAAMRWQTKVVAEVLTGRTLWFLPVTARDIADADGAVIGYVTTLGELEAQYPQISTWTPEDRMALASWRPKDAKDWIHPMMDKAMRASALSGRPLETAQGETDPLTPVFCYRLYYGSCAAYPDGAIVVTSGAKLLHRQPWTVTIGEGTEQERRESLLVPIAQFRWRDDAVDQSPYGIAGAEELGPSEEVAGQMYAALTEYVYRFNHPNVYLPAGSPVQPGQLARRDGTPITVNMDGGGRPIYEDIPTFTPEAMNLAMRLEAQQNSAIGLEQAAQGVASSSVKSGVHAQQVIEQALVALSNQVQNLGDCYTRFCRILTQNWRAWYTTPQLTKLVGAGGSYKAERWMGTDLSSTQDIRIAKGSMTTLAPTMKQQLAMQELEIGRANGDPMAYARYRQTSEKGTAPMLGEQDDPHRLRVERQIEAFWSGPSEDVTAAEGQYAAQMAMVAPQMQQQYMQMQQQAQQQALMAAQSGQPAQPTPPLPPFEQWAQQQMPSPLTVAAQAVWRPLPTDGEPSVAQIRWLALRDVVPNPKVGGKPAAWQTALYAAYDEARKAAGVMTMGEQQQNAQQGQQAEAQAEAAKEGAKTTARETAKKQVELQAAPAELQLDAQRETMQAAARGASPMMI